MKGKDKLNLYACKVCIFMETPQNSCCWRQNIFMEKKTLEDLGFETQLCGKKKVFNPTCVTVERLLRMCAC